MHPDKFLGRQNESVKPVLSAVERAERLSALGGVIAEKRKEAIDARKASGIESVWLACEEAYLGIDDMNRHEFAEAKWAKPTSMSGSITANTRQISDDPRSTAFVRMTSRYVDSASAKLCEILLPIDDKAFKFGPTPDPELVKQLDDKTPLADPATGQPAMQAAPTEPGAPPAAGAPVPVTPASQAQQIMDTASDAATKAETRIYDWMVESKYPAEARKVAHDAARIGCGVLKGPFPDVRTARAVTHSPEGVKLEIKKSVAPAVRWVDAWNLFPDDACGEDVQHGDYILERDFMSTKMLKRLKGQDGYLDDMIDKVIEEGPGKMFAEGANPSDKKSRKRYEIWYYYGMVKRDDMELAQAIGIEDLPDDQEEVPAILSIVNDTVIKAIINPLDSGNFPYRVFSWSRRPGHWAGVGPGELLNMPQRVTNASTRGLLNNAGLSSGVQIVINRSGITPANGSWAITPNKIWYATGEGSGDVTKDFAAVIIPNVGEKLMAIIEYGMKLAEEVTGIPLVTQGQTGPTTPQTFGQAELQNNNSLTWLRSVAERYDDQITEPLVDDHYEWLLLDPSVPDDEKGDFQIDAHGSSAMVERAIQEQVLMGLLQASANPAFEVDPPKLFAEYLKSKRLDPRKIMLSPEQVAQRNSQPPAPPLPIAVEQLKGQNALQLVQAKAQADAALTAQEMQHEQQALQSGGTTPHMASAMAQIEREKIRSQTAQVVEASRAHAEESRADKEMLIAQQNGQFKIEELQLKERLALLQYAQDNKTTLDEARVQLADRAMQEKTRRSLGAAEIELAASENEKDRGVDLHKHTTSLIRDEISTPNTP